jgi:hypothetical protein
VIIGGEGGVEEKIAGGEEGEVLEVCKRERNYRGKVADTMEG